MRVIWRLFTRNAILKNFGIIFLSTLLLTASISLLIRFSFAVIMLSFIITQLFGLLWKNRYDRVRALRIGVRITHIISIVCSLLLIFIDLIKIDHELAFTETIIIFLLVVILVQGFIISHYESVTSPNRRLFHESMDTSPSASIRRRSTSHKRENLMFMALDENERARSEGRKEPFPGWDKERIYYGGWEEFVDRYDDPRYTLSGDDFPDDPELKNLYNKARKERLL